MKKIGLCVCYDTKNYGSQLQILATIKKIEEFGYSTEIIRYNKKLTLKFIVQMLPRLLNPYFVSNKIVQRKNRKKINMYTEVAEKVKIRNYRFEQFAENFFVKMSKTYEGWECLEKQSAENYDAFLCGSDQLWLPSNLGSHFYTLEFAPDYKPKIAYATSFGVSRIPRFQKKRTAKYLNRFQAMSTREITGSKIVTELTGKKAQVVCDPTLLFDKESWSSMIPNKKVINEPYIFCYFLGANEEHRKAVNELKRETGLALVTCPFLDNFVEADQTFGDIQVYDMDASDFVNMIRYAEYVLTDSFHGTLFSIIYQKKFLIFNRFNNGANSRNSRIDSLCTLLGLRERRYYGDTFIVQRNINYVQVEDKLRSLRLNSIQYLKMALKIV